MHHHENNDKLTESTETFLAISSSETERDLGRSTAIDLQTLKHFARLSSPILEDTELITDGVGFYHPLQQ